MLHGCEKTIELAAEKISEAGDDGDPRDGSQKIEEGEGLPMHAQDTRQRTRNDAGAGDKASEEYC